MMQKVLLGLIAVAAVAGWVVRRARAGSLGVAAARRRSGRWERCPRGEARPTIPRPKIKRHPVEPKTRCLPLLQPSLPATNLGQANIRQTHRSRRLQAVVLDDVY